MHTKLEGAKLVVLSTCFGEADLECYEGDLGLDAQDWKALTWLSLERPPLRATPKMALSVTLVQNAKIEQDRLPN